MSNDEIVYPLSHMRETAANIHNDAQNALDEHEKAWKLLDSHLNDYPDFLQKLLRAIVEPHEKRMRATYHWQMAYAQGIKDGADAMEQTDKDISHGFEDGSPNGTPKPGLS